MKSFISFFHSVICTICCQIFTTCKQLFLAIAKFNLSLSLILTIIGTVYSANIFADQYVAGSTTIYIHDPSRTFLPYGAKPINTPGSIRTNIAEMWYPVNPDSIDSNSVRARYIDYFQGHNTPCQGQSANNLTPLPGLTGAQISPAVELHCSTSAPEGLRGSYLNAPIAKGAFPVIFIVTGSAANLTAFGSYAEKLAQNGYIVISVGNTGDSPFAAPATDPHFCDLNFNRVLCVADGSGGYIPNPAIFKVSYSIYNSASPPNKIPVTDSTSGILPQISPLAVPPPNPTTGSQRVIMKKDDVLSEIAAVKSMNSGNPCSALSTTCDPTLPNNFQGHFDLANMAVIGHSLGDEVVLQTLNTNSDFKVGIALMAISINTPASDRPIIQKPIMYVLAQMDDSIIPGICNQASKGFSIAPTPDNRDPDILNQYNAATNAAVYMMILDDTHNHINDDGSFLYPNLAATAVFDPIGPVSPYCSNTFTIPFTLIPSATVHEIRDERTIPFLNLYLKQYTGNANGISKQQFDQLTAPDDTGYMTFMYRNLDVNDFINHGPPKNK